MTVVVIRRVRGPDTEVGGEILEVRNATVVPMEVVVPIRDARVDHSNADTAARQTELLTRESGSGGEAGPLERGERRPVEVDALDLRVRGKGC